MPLDLARLAERRKEIQKKTGDYFKPTEGRNTIRVFMFNHKVTAEDVKAKLFPEKDLGKIVSEIDRSITQHFNCRADNRPVLSTPEIMAQYKAAKREDPKLADEIKPSKRFLLNVVDTGSTELAVKTWAAPRVIIEAVYDSVTNEELGPSILGISGRDFVVTFKPKEAAAMMYTIQLRDSKHCKPIASDVAKQAKDFYNPDVLSEMFASSEETEVAPSEEGVVEEEVTEETVAEDETLPEEPTPEAEPALFDEPEPVEETEEEPQPKARAAVARAPVKSAVRKFVPAKKPARPAFKRGR